MFMDAVRFWRPPGICIPNWVMAWSPGGRLLEAAGRAVDDVVGLDLRVGLVAQIIERADGPLQVGLLDRDLAEELVVAHDVELHVRPDLVVGADADADLLLALGVLLDLEDARPNRNAGNQCLPG